MKIIEHSSSADPPSKRKHHNPLVEMELVEFVHRDPFMQVISRVALLRDAHGVRVVLQTSRTIAITLNTRNFNTTQYIPSWLQARETHRPSNHIKQIGDHQQEVSRPRVPRVSVGCLGVWCCSWFLRSSCCCCLVAWLRRYLSWWLFESREHHLLV